MSPPKVQPVDLTVLDKEYRVACSKEEIEGLQIAARYLDKKMREIRDAGRVVGLERIAVMAALNISHELTQSSGEDGQLSNELSERIDSIKNKIDLIIGSVE